jgi:prolipoprotein diacylglyceryl transferase
MNRDLILASIPSPDQGVWQVGPLPVRAYALCIIAGVFAAIWIGEKRFQARGGLPGTVGDVAVWAVPFGLVGARLYHVITDYQLYFGEGADPIRALYVWEGGLGIWGSVTLGALGAYIGCRRNGVRFSAFADAVAPGLAVAQAIGRWGNWFNQELFGKPTTLPWGLEIDPEFRPDDYAQFETFHPTYLYEFIWNLGVAGVLVWADRRFKLGFGRVFWLYVMLYTLGRVWIEYLRIDEVNDVLGVRLNVWTSVLVFLLALAFFVRSARRHPGRETWVDRRVEEADAEEAEAVESGAEAPQAAAEAEGPSPTEDENEAESRPEPPDAPGPIRQA